MTEEAREMLVNIMQARVAYHKAKGDASAYMAWGSALECFKLADDNNLDVLKEYDYL